MSDFFFAKQNEDGTYGEPHPRNPDLDKYIYVLKGE